MKNMNLGQFCYSFLFYKSFLNTNISCHNIFFRETGVHRIIIDTPKDAEVIFLINFSNFSIFNHKFLN